VRGQFKDLTNATRSYLLSTAADHDLFLSSFTQEGTFTYDERLQFFNLRYEVRHVAAKTETTLRTETTLKTETTPENPEIVALREAELFLRTMRITHGPLRAAVMDMTDMVKRQ
jgi:Family of unknown function (DUF6204)